MGFSQKVFFKVAVSIQIQFSTKVEYMFEIRFSQNTSNEHARG